MNRQEIAERRERVKELVAQNMSASEIARELGVPFSTVRNDLRKMGLRAVNGNLKAGEQRRNELADKVRLLVEEGKSVQAICNILGTNHDTVHKIAEENNFKLNEVKKGRRSSLTPEIEKRIIELHNQGKSQKEIGQAVGRGVATISRTMKRLGLTPNRPTNGIEKRHLNFGKTKEERSETARTGGKNSNKNGVTATCLRPSCGKEFGQFRNEKTGRYSRAKYCSKECAYAHRSETSGAKVEYVCQNRSCGKTFVGWAIRPQKYCSRQCYQRHVPTKVGLNGIVFDSSWESLFYSTTQFLHVPCERFNREECVLLPDGNSYGPDFFLPTLGLYVEVKGVTRERDPMKWDEFSREKPLVILGEEEMSKVRLCTSAEEFERYMESLPLWSS